MNPLILCVFTCFILFETSLEIFTRFNKCPFQHDRLLKNNTILCRNTSFFGISFFLGHFLWSAVVHCYVSNFLVELTGTVSIPYKYKHHTHKKERKNHWPNGQPAQCWRRWDKVHKYHQFRYSFSKTKYQHNLSWGCTTYHYNVVRNCMTSHETRSISFDRMLSKKQIGIGWGVLHHDSTFNSSPSSFFSRRKLTTFWIWYVIWWRLSRLYIHDIFSRRQNYLFAHASGIFFPTYLIKCDIFKKRIKSKKKSQIWKGVVVGIESYNKPVTKQSENDIFLLYRKVALFVYSVLYKKKGKSTRSPNWNATTQHTVYVSTTHYGGCSSRKYIDKQS